MYETSVKLAPEVRRRLQRIEVRDPDLDLTDFPRFLIIGPPRTGTHWLATNLGRHPEVFLPRDIVELYYFSSLESPPGDYMGLPPGLCRDLGWYLRHFRETPEERAVRQAEARTLQRTYRRRISGEATSVYALGVSAAVLEDLLLLAPDLKVILTVRNPMERAWSNAKLELGTRYACRMEDVDPAAIRHFLSDPYHRHCGDYGAIRAHWQRHLRPGHLLLRSFEAAQRDPKSSLREVYRFLDVEDAPELVPANVATKVNASDEQPIPACHRSLVEELFGDQVRQLRATGLLP